MFNEMLYILAVKWLVFRLIGSDEINGRNNSMRIIDLQFVESILRIRRRIHHAEMFPIEKNFGLRMADSEIRKECFGTQRKCTFVAKGNVIGE